MNSIKKYYAKAGTYLRDHKDYLTEENLKRDVEFIIKSLKLTKKDTCLDLQCAQGRLTIELTRRGYHVDGLDFSEHMVRLSRESAVSKNLDIDFFRENLHSFKLPRKFTKVFLYFPDWREIHFGKVLSNIKKILTKGGLFLYDQDSLFRLWSYLKQNPKEKKRFHFDPLAMTLKEKGDKMGTRYYVYPELEKIFKQHGFKILKTYGGWAIEDGDYAFDSRRLRIVAKKE